MITNIGAKSLLCIVGFSITICFSGIGQYSDYGKITFERKTNLLKRFQDSRMSKMINEDNKIKIDKFELLFNDTSSVFRPIQDVSEGRMGWMTTKNHYSVLLRVHYIIFIQKNFMYLCKDQRV